MGGVVGNYEFSGGREYFAWNRSYIVRGWGDIGRKSIYFIFDDLGGR